MDLEGDIQISKSLAIFTQIVVHQTQAGTAGAEVLAEALLGLCPFCNFLVQLDGAVVLAFFPVETGQVYRIHHLPGFVAESPGDREGVAQCTLCIAKFSQVEVIPSYICEDHCLIGFQVLLLSHTVSPLEACQASIELPMMPA